MAKCEHKWEAYDGMTEDGTVIGKLKDLDFEDDKIRLSVTCNKCGAEGSVVLFNEGVNEIMSGKETMLSKRRKKK